MLLCLYLPKLYATLQSNDVTKFGYRTPVFQNENRTGRDVQILETMNTSLRGSASSSTFTCDQNSMRRANSSEAKALDAMVK